MNRWINKTPSRPFAVFLGVLPFILLMALYQWGSDTRKAENLNDKLLPSVSEFHSAIDRLAFTPSKRTGEYLFWQDTSASLSRILIGISISALAGLLMGLLTGLIPLARSGLSPFITIISSSSSMSFTL